MIITPKLVPKEKIKSKNNPNFEKDSILD